MSQDLVWDDGREMTQHLPYMFIAPAWRRRCLLLWIGQFRHMCLCTNQRSIIKFPSTWGKNKIINVRIHFDLFFSDMGQTQDMNIIYPLELPFVRTDPISRHTHPYIALVNATSPNEQIRPRWRRVGAPPRRLDEAADFQNQPRTWFPVWRLAVATW